MNKQEIVMWLNTNSGKSDGEIEKFLFSEMNGEDFKESWCKHYFLEELKSPVNGFSKNVLEIISYIQKEINGVPIWKRYIAFCIDFIVWSLLCLIFYVFPINPESAVGAILIFMVYIIYISVSIYKCKTTFGLYLFGIKVEFGRNNLLLLRIILREIIFLSIATGVGFIFYLIFGPYWDKITGARVVWTKQIR